MTTLPETEGCVVTTVVFHDAQGPGANALFGQWRTEHPRGFFLNYGSVDDMIVHRVDCPHFTFREARSLTSYKKVCSENIEELKSWTTDHGQNRPGFCRTCSPRA